MKQKLTLSFLVLVLSFFYLAKAEAQVSMGMHYNITQPLNDYENNLHQNPKGFSFSMMNALGKSEVLFLGGEMGVSMYANESYLLEIENEYNELESIDITEEDCYLRYNAFLRYIPFNHKVVSPYAEISLGGVSFFSTQIVDEGFEDYFDNQTKFHGTAFNLSGGAGLLVRLSQYVALDVAVMANRGQKTHYRSIAPSDANLKRTLEDGRHESFTHHVNYRFGFVFGF